jgi:hypothetical protein
MAKNTNNVAFIDEKVIPSSKKVSQTNSRAITVPITELSAPSRVANLLKKPETLI